MKPTSQHQHVCRSHEHAHSLHGGAGGSLKPKDQRREDRTKLRWALSVTLGIAAAEVTGGYLSNSLSLMADAGHMLADGSGILLSLVALYISSRPADPRKTYGYFRAEILGALFNGMLLFGIAFFVVFEAWSRFKTPEVVQLGTAMLVALVGLVANLLALRVLHRAHTLNVRSAFLHVLSDTLSSVGVLVGLGLMWWWGWTWLDALISCGIALVVVWGAIRVMKEAVDVLLEAVPSHLEIERIRTLMSQVPGVRAVHDLHVWTISSGIYALSAHLVVADPAVNNNDHILNAMKLVLLENFGIDHTTIQIESDAFSHAGEVH